MPTGDSSKPEACYNCNREITGPRWQAAIKSSEGGGGREPGSTPAGVGVVLGQCLHPLFLGSQGERPWP